MFYHTEYSPIEIKQLLEVGAKMGAIPLNPDLDTSLHISHSDNEVELNASKIEQKLMEISPKIYLFDQIKPADVLKIVKNIRFLKFAEGETIFDQGDKTTDMFFLLNGGVEIKLDEKPIMQVKAGTIIGEMAFVTGKPRNASCKATGDTGVIGFEINENGINSGTVYLYLQLYINIAGSVATKLENCNQKLLIR